MIILSVFTEYRENNNMSNLYEKIRNNSLVRNIRKRNTSNLLSDIFYKLFVVRNAILSKSDSFHYVECRANILAKNAN